MTMAVLMAGLFTRDVDADAADRPTTRNGLPVTYREVEVARPWRYKSVRGQTLTLTVDELDRLAERFVRMHAVGVAVLIVRGGREGRISRPVAGGTPARTRHRPHNRTRHRLERAGGGFVVVACHDFGKVFRPARPRGL